MTSALLRDAIDMLLQEAYDGPADPQASWIVTSAPDTGVLGTVRHLTVEQAWHKPEGLAHSVAQHVAHILFSLNHAMQCAQSGRREDADWESSWHAGPPEEATWQNMQRQLRETHLRLRMWVHADEAFKSKESVARLIAAIAHAAYHLGALRQVAKLATNKAPAEDPMAPLSRPL